MKENDADNIPTLEFDRGTLRVTGFQKDALDSIAPELPWEWDSRDSSFRTDALYYSHFKHCLRKLFAGTLNDSIPQWQEVRWGEINIHALRDEQVSAVEAWELVKQGCVVMPTGTGKTEVALSIMSRNPVSTLIVSPVRDLMYQWHRRILNALGVDAGIVGDNVFKVLPVSVTTYDSAYIHMPLLGNRFEMIIFDECHHLPGLSRSEAALMSAAPMRLGLTATLERADGRHELLDRLIGPVCYDLGLKQVRGRSVADYEVVRIPVHLSDEERQRYDDLSQQVRRYMVKRREETPSFSWEDLCSDVASTQEARQVLRAFYAKRAIEDRATEKLRVLEDLFRLHAGQPCLVFAGSNAMAREVSCRFLIPCLLNHCGKSERIEVLEGLEAGRYPAIVANQVLDEGVDLPQVNVAIVIGGGGSTRQAKQRLGRVLRRGSGAPAILYEIVTEDTNEVQRSRKRRKNDAYEGTRHRRI